MPITCHPTPIPQFLAPLPLQKYIKTPQQPTSKPRISWHPKQPVHVLSTQTKKQTNKQPHLVNSPPSKTQNPIKNIQNSSIPRNSPSVHSNNSFKTIYYRKVTTKAESTITTNIQIKWEILTSILILSHFPRKRIFSDYLPHQLHLQKPLASLTVKIYHMGRLLRTRHHGLAFES